MKQATATRLFWTYTGLSVLGIALLTAGSAAAGRSTFGSVLGGGIVGLLGGVAIILAGLIELVVWLGTLIHTARHEHWVWFVVTLLLTWTWLAMLAYVLFGPKDAQVPARVRA